MSCGCNKGRSYTESSPLVIGEQNGDPPAQYRTTISLLGLKANSTFWATGSGVAAMAHARWIIPV